jgi:hypothetical protein
MPGERSGFVKIEELMAQVSLEQVLTYYGVEMPEIRRIGEEVRVKCFLNCGRKGETGERTPAIQGEHAAKIWRCFEAGCGKGGNLVSLCDFLKPGEHGGGKPRGERFKGILKDLQAIIAGEKAGEPAEDRGEKADEPRDAANRRIRAGNVPLKDSPNERARALVSLDSKFISDPADMSQKAASYFRHRRFLTPEMCRKWRVGYLPRDAGSDHAGGTMRGKIVYPFLSEEGEVLTWFGRNPGFEEEYQAWIASGKQDKEPEKYHFVKGFQRGLELFGQQRIREEGIAEQLKATGLIVVEGPNDVIALEVLGVPAIALCARAPTKEQVEKVVRLAREVAGGVVSLMFGCDDEGEMEARAALVEVARRCPVRLVWSQEMYGGAFKGRKPQSLTKDEWEGMRKFLAAGREEAMAT